MHDIECDERGSAVTNQWRSHCFSNELRAPVSGARGTDSQPIVLGHAQTMRQAGPQSRLVME
jgi:hypothetical protein